jgi:CPA2 family monovalent cation:H+ antiporter-2
MVPVIIDLNHDTVSALNREGVLAVYGDASRREIIDAAGVRAAKGFVYAASGSPESTVRLAREMNPDLLVLARATYATDVDALRKIGVDEVVSAECEVALAMVERLLVQLGAAAEQLDRARDRVRAKLGGPAVTC